MLLQSLWMHLVALVITTTLMVESWCCQGFVLQQSHGLQTTSVSNSNIFVRSPPSTSRSNKYKKKKHFDSIPPSLPTRNTNLHVSQLQEQLVFPILSKTLKKLVIGTTIFLVSLFNYRRILWPGSLPDKSFKEPLPPGQLGCPFFGVLFDITKPFKMMKKKKKINFNEARLKFVYAFFQPMVFASGKNNIRRILNSEFDEKGTEIATFFQNETKILGGSSILFSKDKVEHGYVCLCRILKSSELNTQRN